MSEGHVGLLHVLWIHTKKYLCHHGSCWWPPWWQRQQSTITVICFWVYMYWKQRCAAVRWETTLFRLIYTSHWIPFSQFLCLFVLLKYLFCRWSACSMNIGSVPLCTSQVLRHTLVTSRVHHGISFLKCILCDISAAISCWGWRTMVRSIWRPLGGGSTLSLV